MPDFTKGPYVLRGSSIMAEPSGRVIARLSKAGLSPDPQARRDGVLLAVSWDLLRILKELAAVTDLPSTPINDERYAAAWQEADRLLDRLNGDTDVR